MAKLSSQYHVPKKSMDERLVAATVEQLGMAKSIAYEGMLTYVTENGKFYVFDGTNFQEFKSGNDVTAVAIEDGKVKVTLEDGTVRISDDAFIDTDTCRIHTVNGGDAGNFEIYAPLAADCVTAQKGQVLVFDGQLSSPKWVDVNTLVQHPDIVVDDGTL